MAGSLITRGMKIRKVLVTLAITVGAVAIIIVVVVQGSLALQGPSDDKPPNAAEWLSAISTFWGAVAAALGAAVTGGALLIAALTYQRQIRDKHAELEDKRREDEKKRREQAEAVTVRIGASTTGQIDVAEDSVERLWIEIRNDGKLAIFGVALVLITKERREGHQELYSTILPGESEGWLNTASVVGGAYATFTDGAGTRWKRWHNGDLEEIAHYPTTRSE